MCDTTHTHVYVCSDTLFCTNSKVVHVEFFCEVNFVFFFQTVGCLLAFNIWSGDISVSVCS